VKQESAVQERLMQEGLMQGGSMQTDTMQAGTTPRHILVVGGAGYIGSHMVKRLARAGYLPVILDNLTQGRRSAVLSGHLIVGEMADRAALETIFQAFPIAAVMHFASHIEVGESLAAPGKYYENNIGNTIGLLNAMVRHKVLRLIFSSSAAIFGNPVYIPIDEYHPAAPINPYGYSKLVVEQMLADFERAYGLRAICLRYFNAAGADPEGELGECHAPETHLIPLILQAASGRRPALTIYGSDYETPDGTCVRDYVHVQDLCDAHLLALQALLAGAGSARYNLGNGNGYSIVDVIKTAEQLCGHGIAQRQAPRRAGDPAILIADSTLAKKQLHWTPRFGDIATIVKHAWQWEQNHFSAAAMPAPALPHENDKQDDKQRTTLADTLAANDDLAKDR